MNETKDLIIRAQNGDIKAKEKLVSDNIGLIWSIVKRFANRGYELDDLYQIGAVGLLKCIDKFDTKYDVKFSTYAVPMIIGEIKRFLRDDGIIKISRPIKEISIKIKQAQENFISQNDKPPTLNELSDYLNISREELIMAMDANKNIESIYQPTNQSDTDNISVIDKIKSDDTTLKIINKIAVNDVINKLEDYEKEIIIQRYFYDKTQTEVAKKLNMSQVQISRLEKKILLKMRQSF